MCGNLTACQPIWDYFVYIFCVVSSVFCIQLYDIKYSYLIQITCKQIYQVHRWDLNRCYHSGSEGTGVMVIKEYSKFLRYPELEPQYQMQFSVIARTFLEGGSVLISMQGIQSVYSKSHQQRTTLSAGAVEYTDFTSAER